MKKLLLCIFFTTQIFSQSVGYDLGKFAFDLDQTLPQLNENIVFSPYSIFSNLALISYGADTETAQQIQKVLHLSQTGERFLQVFHKQLKGLGTLHKDGYQCNIANGLFPNKETHFLKNFDNIAKEFFLANLQSVDYKIVDQALKTINGYVYEKTHGKISKILDKNDINNSTRFVIVNSIYFEGDWSHPFPLNKTKMSPFYTKKENDFKVPTLSQVQFFPYYEDDELQCLSLPFSRKDSIQPLLECVIVLPKKDSLVDVNSTLSFTKLNKILDLRKMHHVSVEIPKFCFSQRINLNTSLITLGMKLPFTYQADFSKIDGTKNLFLNTVIHETFFSFYEKGVTASAATASSIEITSEYPSIDDIIVFKANHPFFFFIIDYHSRSILFMGRCYKPEGGLCYGN